jgi:hypothetical protein
MLTVERAFFPPGQVRKAPAGTPPGKAIVKVI